MNDFIVSKVKLAPRLEQLLSIPGAHNIESVQNLPSAIVEINKS